MNQISLKGLINYSDFWFSYQKNELQSGLTQHSSVTLQTVLSHQQIWWGHSNVKSFFFFFNFPLELPSFLYELWI